MLPAIGERCPVTAQVIRVCRVREHDAMSTFATVVERPAAGHMSDTNPEGLGTGQERVRGIMWMGWIKG